LEKTLYFYDFTNQSGTFRFEEKKNDKGLMIAINPIQLHWDDNLLYMSSKKAYVILRKKDGQMLQQIPHDRQQSPMITLSKSNKCLILA